VSSGGEEHRVAPDGSSERSRPPDQLKAVFKGLLKRNHRGAGIVFDGSNLIQAKRDVRAFSVEHDPIGKNAGLVSSTLRLPAYGDRRDTK
jgi:hypothetical protein